MPQSLIPALISAGLSSAGGLGVKPGPVEPPVHPVLDPAPDRVEQGCRGQRRSGHRDRGANTGHMDGQRKRPPP